MAASVPGHCLDSADRRLTRRMCWPMKMAVCCSRSVSCSADASSAHSCARTSHVSSHARRVGLRPEERHVSTARHPRSTWERSTWERWRGKGCWTEESWVGCDLGFAADAAADHLERVDHGGLAHALLPLEAAAREQAEPCARQHHHSRCETSRQSLPPQYHGIDASHDNTIM